MDIPKSFQLIVSIASPSTSWSSQMKKCSLTWGMTIMANLSLILSWGVEDKLSVVEESPWKKRRSSFWSVLSL